MKRHLLRALVIAFISSVLGGAVYYGTELETGLGLNALFHLRGTRQPPSEVVVVAMDEKSEEDLGASWKDYTLWRKFHAKLVRELNRQGAKLIIFDLQFVQPQPEIDPEFTAALEEAGNVLVTECVAKINYWSKEYSGREQCSQNNTRPPVRMDGGKVEEYRIEMKKFPPADVILKAILDRAPFYLPDDAKNPVIQEAWTFIDRFDEAPALPVLAWFHYLHKTDALAVAEDSKQLFSQSLAKYRQVCKGAPIEQSGSGLMPFAVRQPKESPATGVPIRQAQALKIGLHKPEPSQAAENFGRTISGNTQEGSQDLSLAITELVCSEDQTRYLDFYGPPQTLAMVSYSDVYSGLETDFKDKVVFVGKANRSFITGSTIKDVFYTPFTNNETGRMFGVEIMATQFANLLENRFIQSPYPPLLILFAFSLTAGLLLCWASNLTGVTASLMMSLSYAGFAVCLFGRYAYWLPVATPLLIQLPAVWLVSLQWSRRDLLKEKERIIAFINRAFPKWLSRLPSSAREWPSDKITQQLTESREVFGICLCTDIQGYTETAYRLPPRQLGELLETYYHVAGQPVSANKGLIANVQGDAMMAFWIDSSFEEQAQAACAAALEIGEAVSRFNNTEQYPLPTRIGLCEGEFLLRSGDAGDFRYFNPFGNSLNTVSRIESMNKLLGTKILATEAIAKTAKNIMCRPVGAFLLAGLGKPLELVEIIASNTDTSTHSYPNLCDSFSQGLSAFQQQRWQEAAAIFIQILADCDDGPSRFYLELADTYNQKPPADWQGYVRLSTK